MRIAIVGSGISGMAAAWLLSREHEVTLFEAAERLGGHTHTHVLERDGRLVCVDTGFIVFNPAHYPLFTRMLDALGVASQPTTMSFSVSDQRSGLEYNATNLNRLFCQRRNLLSPRFWGMLWDLRRFYREAPSLLERPDPGPTLGEYLETGGYGQAFREQHLVPMASALWSSPSARVLDFPARYLVQFMANHCMLTLGQRPAWRVICGGSHSYLAELRSRTPAALRVNCPVQRIQRSDDAVLIQSPVGEERFDQVVLACHSDQALALLADPSEAEREILGAIGYQHNDTVLHTDVRLLPRQRAAWAAWNARIDEDSAQQCTVSYCMNLLQGLDTPETYVVTLNGTQHIDPQQIIARMDYSHPQYTHASVAAQARRGEISGQRRTWYAGAYWGWGFHEDGLRSAVDVARGLGLYWP